MDLKLEDKNVLVIGGSHGIGFEIAKAFSEEGSNMTLVSRSKNRLEKAVNELSINKNNHSFISSNLLEIGGVDLLKKKLIKKKYDVVVHCVGGALGLGKAFSNIDDWIKVWWFNVGAAITLNNYLIPKMIEQEWGRVIHISSISGVKGELPGGSIAYSAAKAYLNEYIEGISRETASQNVIVSGILPGAVRTEGKYWDNLSKESPEKVEKFLNDRQSIGRLGEPKEIAPFAVLLGSNLASFAAGCLLPLTGARY